jgi:hypothetical protein
MIQKYFEPCIEKMWCENISVDHHDGLCLFTGVIHEGDDFDGVDVHSINLVFRINRSVVTVDLDTTALSKDFSEGFSEVQ